MVQVTPVSAPPLERLPDERWIGERWISDLLDDGPRAAIIAGRPDPAIEEALADALVSESRYDEAYRHYGEACVLRPGYAFCHYNMAEILFHRHQLRDALEQYRLAGSLT